MIKKRLKFGVLGIAFLLVAWLCLGFMVPYATDYSSQMDQLSSAERVDVERLTATLKDLTARAERMSNEGQSDTADYLANQLALSGYQPVRQEYEYKGRNWTNIIVSNRPFNESTPTVVVMAHYDSIAWPAQSKNAPGADDNGSGIAVLLELARRYYSVKTEMPILFCFFSNEEVGLRGSKYFVSWLKETAIPVEAAVNLDVLGYNRPKPFIDWKAVFAHRGWGARLKSLLKQVNNIIKSFKYGDNAVLVAAKPQYGHLVNRVGDAMKPVSTLTIIERAREDCG